MNNKPSREGLSGMQAAYPLRGTYVPYVSRFCWDQ